MFLERKLSPTSKGKGIRIAPYLTELKANGEYPQKW